MTESHPTLAAALDRLEQVVRSLEQEGLRRIGELQFESSNFTWLQRLAAPDGAESVVQVKREWKVPGWPGDHSA